MRLIRRQVERAGSRQVAAFAHPPFDTGDRRASGLMLGATRGDQGRQRTGKTDYAQK